MKSIFRFLGFISLLFAFTFESFALDAPIGVEIESYTDTSVVLKWEPLENAVMYYAYYSTESGIGKKSENYSDFIEGTSVEINDLEKGKKYYFTVTSLDENGEESVDSNEIIFDVKNMDSSKKSGSDFVLDRVDVVSYNKIKLSFTSPLNNSIDTIREFKIVNKADNLDTFEVISSKLDVTDNSVIELTLDKNIKLGAEYEIVIVAITSADGRNIESGIDNVEIFTADEIGDFVEYNSAGIEEPSITGTNIDAKQVENTTLALAKKQVKLPQTGPEQILMLILSAILGSLIFIFKYKKA